jgi:hypothetical protein
MSPLDEMDDELSPEEKAAFAALPREREPSRLLEERTVRALRDAGVIRPKAKDAPRRLRFPAGWMVGAAAAAVALFFTGIETGRMLTERQTGRIVEVVQAKNPQQAAVAVQQTGSAYVTALSRFTSLADSASPAQTQQGREVAVQMLRAAAGELVRMAPDDPLAADILAALDRARTQQKPARGDSTGKDRLVWF